MDAEQDRMLLVLAAAEGTLDDAQRSALEGLRAVDPGIDDEIDSLKDVLAGVDRFGAQWQESAMDLAPSTGVLDAALEQIAQEDAGGELAPVTEIGAATKPDATTEQARPRDADRTDRHPGRRGLLLGVAAAGLVATGAVGSDVIRRVRPETPIGRPGELGAFEELSVTGVQPGANVDIGLIAHTWGTETVLVVDGSEPGAVYELQLVASDGTVIDSGSFLGTEAPLDCEMNAAILREDVTELMIVTQDGSVWAQAQLPAVTA